MSAFALPRLNLCVRVNVKVKVRVATPKTAERIFITFDFAKSLSKMLKLLDRDVVSLYS